MQNGANTLKINTLKYSEKKKYEEENSNDLSFILNFLQRGVTGTGNTRHIRGFLKINH